jgi:hypothetical protein
VPLPLPLLLPLLVLPFLLLVVVVVLKLLPLLHQMLAAAIPGVSTANTHTLLCWRVTQCHAG